MTNVKVILENSLDSLSFEVVSLLRHERTDLFLLLRLNSRYFVDMPVLKFDGRVSNVSFSFFQRYPAITVPAGGVKVVSVHIEPEKFSFLFVHSSDCFFEQLRIHKSEIFHLIRGENELDSWLILLLHFFHLDRTIFILIFKK